MCSYHILALATCDLEHQECHAKRHIDASLQFAHPVMETTCLRAHRLLQGSFKKATAA